LFEPWVFNGTTAYSLTGPEVLGAQQRLTLTSDDKTSSITIEYIKSISTYDKLRPEVSNLLNILTKKLLRALDLIQIGRNYFYKKPMQVRGQPLELYKGFTFVVSPAVEGKLNVIIDLTSRVVRNKTVRDIMNEISQTVRGSFRGRPEQDIHKEIERRVQHAISGMVVLCKYNLQTWRIDHVKWTVNLNSEFECGGKQTSFRQYYLERYKLNVRSNDAGLLVSVRKRKGVVVKETMLIPELCHPTGVTEEMKANFQVMKALSLNTRLPPSKRVNEINYLVNNILQQEKAQSQMAKMPLTLDKNSSRVQARVLGPFDVVFNRGKTTLRDNKSFSRDVRDAGFFKGSVPLKIGTWCFLYSKQFEREAKQFGRCLIQLSGRQGCQLKDPVWLPAPPARSDKVKVWTGILNQAMAKRPQLLVALLPFGDAQLYSFVKYVCTVRNPVVSQCVNTQSLNPKMLMPIAGNCFKQIMHKMGHTDWKIPYPKYTNNPSFKTQYAQTMIVGVAVSLDKKLKTSYGKQPEKKRINGRFLCVF